MTEQNTNTNAGKPPALKDTTTSPAGLHLRLYACKACILQGFCRDLKEILQHAKHARHFTARLLCLCERATECAHRVTQTEKHATPGQEVLLEIETFKMFLPNIHFAWQAVMLYDAPAMPDDTLMNLRTKLRTILEYYEAFEEYIFLYPEDF